MNRAMVEPHRAPRWATQFTEGWYHRLVDHDAGIDLVLIFGRTTRRRGANDDRLICLLKTAERVYSEEVTPGGPVSCASAAEDAYVIEGPNFRFTENAVHARIGDLTIDVTYSRGESWFDRRGSHAGVRSWLAAMPKVIDWEVFGIGADADYRIEIAGGQRWSGRGRAHKEKNWGTVFPAAWVWLNAIDDGIDFIVARSRISNAVPVSVGIAYLRTGDQRQLFRSYVAGESITISARDRTSIKVACRSPRAALTLAAAWNPAEEQRLLVPTSRGWQRDAIEAHLGPAELTLVQGGQRFERTVRGGLWERGGDWERMISSLGQREVS